MRGDILETLCVKESRRLVGQKLGPLGGDM